MLILLIVIFIILGVVLTIKVDDLLGWVVIVVPSIILGSILFIMLLVYPYNIDAKLAMYKEENIKIEEKVKATVMAYMDYESDTYEKLIKDADLTTLMIKYPELNSNTLVKNEIDLYIENSKQIKELKEQKIMISTYRWWIYFGK